MSELASKKFFVLRNLCICSLLLGVKDSHVAAYKCAVLVLLDTQKMKFS